MSAKPDHYETLGIPKGASAAEIKRAYKRKALKVHPDRNGGSTEGFQKLHQAYFTLSDHSRRERYDQTGEDSPKNDPSAEAHARIISLFLSAVDSLDENKTNIIAALRKRLQQEESNDYKVLRAIDMKIKKNERALERVSKKDGGINLIARALQEKIAAYKKNLVLGRESLSKYKLCYLILDEYEYRVDVFAPGEFTSFAQMIDEAVKSKNRLRGSFS